MALDVGQLVAYLELDNRNFEQNADRSESRMSRLASGLGTAVRTVGVAAAGAVVAAGAVGLSTAARMEQADIAFTTMLGSGKKARAFLGDLQRFAAATPFAFPELQTAASSLISAGIEAKKVIPIMTTLGDVTSGMGTGSEGVKRATIALQQMNAAGRITGEDLNQLRDAGIPVYDLLAAATGKSKAEVVKLAQAGKLGKTELEAMMRALETGEGLERFTGLMAKQSQSLTGMWSTLQDTFSVGMANAIQPLIPLIKDGLGQAITFVAAAAPRVAAGLATAVTAVMAFVAALRGQDSGELEGRMQAVATLGARAAVVFDRVKIAVAGAFPRNAAGGVDFAGTLERAEGGARRLWPQIQAAAAQLRGIRPLVDVTGAVFGFLADHLDTLIKYLPLLISLFVAYKTAQAAANVVALASLPLKAAEIASNFALAGANRALAFQLGVLTGVQRTTLLGTIRQTAANAYNAVSTRVAAAGQAAWSMVMFQWNLIQSFGLITTLRMNAAVIAGAVASTVARGATIAWTAAQWLLNASVMGFPLVWVVAGVAALVAGIVLLWKNSETFRVIVTGAWDAVQASVGAVVGFFTGTVLPFFAALPGNIGGYFASAGSWLLGAGQAVLSGLWSGIQAGWTAGIGFLTGLGSTVLGYFAAAASWLADAGSRITSGLWDGIKRGWQLYIGFWTGLATTILGYLTGAATWLSDTGGKITGGLWSGIKSTWTAGTGFFTGLSTTILGLIVGAATWLVGIGEKVTGGLWSGVKAGWTAGVVFLSGLDDTIRSAVGSLGGVLISAGRSIIQGLINGIQQMLGALRSKLSSVTGLIPDWKGPPDTDAQLLRPNGRLIMGGLIAGIGDQVPLLKRQLAGVTASVGGMSLGGQTSNSVLTGEIGGLQTVLDEALHQQTRAADRLETLAADIGGEIEQRLGGTGRIVVGV